MKGDTYRKHKRVKPALPQANEHTRRDFSCGQYPVQKCPSNCCAGLHEKPAAAGGNRRGR